jgi:uncharacterized protein with HEPN domain
VSADYLKQLQATLRRIADLVPGALADWQADELLRLAIERLWITAGNLAEAHRIATGVDAGADPWAELHRFRSLLAHALPGDLSDERVWYESVTDLPRLMRQVEQRCDLHTRAWFRASSVGLRRHVAHTCWGFLLEPPHFGGVRLNGRRLPKRPEGSLARTSSAPKSPFWGATRGRTS